MIKTKIPYLSGEFLVEEDEPTTLVELTSMIGDHEVVRKVVKHFRYHYKYPRVYAEVSQKILPLFPRNENETEVNHLSRFLKDNPNYARSMLQNLFNDVAPLEPLVPKGERGGQGKVSQGAMDAATGYFARGNDAVEDVVRNIESVLVGFTVQRDANSNVTVEGLARGIQKLNRQLMQQAKDKARTILT